MVYRVLADGIDIFGSDTESSLLSPSLETELNSAGSLEFTLPPDHPSYDDISLMQTEIEVYEDDELIFFGRPAEVSIDWNKQKKVSCEGALAYLNDAAIRPHKFEGALISDVFKYIIAQYNAQVAQNKQFIVGNITITDRYVYTEFDYDICLSVLISTCIDSTGGYLFLRKEEAGVYIDWLDEVPDASDQPVQFASNMLDLSQDTKAEDICTVVLPVGGQVDGVNITIASVNQGSDILEDSDAISKYGRILKIQQWNNIIDPQALKDKATEWLAKQQEDDVTIETDAAELHYLDNSVGAYRIGQLVNVISGPHGVDKEYPILKMSMNLDSGTKKITLGTPPRKELTELSGITNSTGGGSSSSGGGGGSSDGVRDVLVNGSSVVSEHVARVSAVTSQQLAYGLATKANQSDLNALGTIVAGKANQSDLNALGTTVAGKQDQIEFNTQEAATETLTMLKADGVVYNLGGGTEVEANPSETATDDLETIKIGDTVYDISSGSNTNYGKFKCDALFVNDPLPSPTSGTASVTRTYTLNGSIDDYDAVYVITYGYYVSSQGATNILSRIVFKNDYYLKGFDNLSYYDGIVDPNYLRRICFTFTDSTHIQTLAFRSVNDVEPILYKVYGLKFENKLINRSDIYSEEERLVGRWTDGKPLYQKTFTFSPEKSIPYNVWTSLGVTIPNGETLIYVCGRGNGTDISASGMEFCLNSNKEILMEYNQNTNVRTIASLTFQYTKTTDTPDSGVLPEDPLIISDPMIYSEDEKMVGTWTDGKPLYQKTFIRTLTGPTSNWVLFDNTVSYEKLINAFTDQLHTNGETLPILQDKEASPRFHSYNNVIDYYTSISGTYTYAITLQYTKTTDSIYQGRTKANIVQRSDIYSEEERLVGRWTDGKPLYQKTFIFTGTFSGESTNIPISLNNPDQVFVLEAHGINLYNAIVPLPYVHANTQNNAGFFINSAKDSIGIRFAQGISCSKLYFTLQYTKTTDTPFSKQLIEDPQMVMMSDYYSEEEQVIGRWTDGKPLYQKTINCGAMPNNDQKTIDISSLNVENIAFSYGNYTDGTRVVILPQGNDRYIEEIANYSFLQNNTIINIASRNRDKSSYTATITLQYTKTTDAPGTGPTKGNLIYLPALYSEEEREVGVWIDGKPIYQKNIPIPTIQSAESGSLLSNLGLDIDTCTDIKVRLYKYTDSYDNDTVIATASYGSMYFFYRKSDDSIRMGMPFSWVVGRSGNITIQYTKTTDQPGSGTWTPEGQLAHHYSTSEKIVGTWIDGSTVYEKTWDFDDQISLPTDAWYSTNISSSGFGKIIKTDSMDINGTYFPIAAAIDQGVIRLMSFRSSGTTGVKLLTLQYTKTT